MNMNLPEAKRAPGSEWLKNRSRFLVVAYHLTKRIFKMIYPIGKRVAPKLFERITIRGEKIVKGYVFNCQMCGQCILHSTGMTCPMNCPKNLRNGPCGGVRIDGNCEVVPDRPCVWVQAWERSRALHVYKDDIQIIQPPVNHALKNTASWINMIEGLDQVKFPES